MVKRGGIGGHSICSGKIMECYVYIHQWRSFHELFQIYLPPDPPVVQLTVIGREDGRSYVLKHAERRPSSGAGQKYYNDYCLLVRPIMILIYYVQAPRSLAPLFDQGGGLRPSAGTGFNKVDESSLMTRLATIMYVVITPAAGSHAYKRGDSWRTLNNKSILYSSKFCIS